MAQQAEALKEEVRELYPGHEVILQFDQVNPNLLGNQSLDIEELVDQMF